MPYYCYMTYYIYVYYDGFMDYISLGYIYGDDILCKY